MTEVLINGKRCTVQDQTLTDYLKIRTLHERGYTYRQINDEFRAGKKTCSNYKIKAALAWEPNGLKKPKSETQTETIETSRLSKPPAPPTRVESETQTETRVKHDEKAMWDSYKRPTPRTSPPIITFKSKDEFVLWVKTLSPEEYTGNRLAAIKRFQEHGRPGLQEGTVDLYIEFCKLPPVRDELMGELKEKLKQRNGGT